MCGRREVRRQHAGDGDHLEGRPRRLQAVEADAGDGQDLAGRGCIATTPPSWPPSAVDRGLLQRGRDASCARRRAGRGATEASTRLPASSSPPGRAPQAVVERQLEAAEADGRRARARPSLPVRAAARRASGRLPEHRAWPASPSGEMRVPLLRRRRRGLRRARCRRARAASPAAAAWSGGELSRRGAARERQRARTRRPRRCLRRLTIAQAVGQHERAEHARADADGHARCPARRPRGCPRARRLGQRSRCASAARARRGEGRASETPWRVGGVDCPVHRRVVAARPTRGRSSRASAFAPMPPELGGRRSRRCAKATQREREQPRRERAGADLTVRGHGAVEHWRVTSLDWLIVAFASILAASRLPPGLHRRRALVRRLRRSAPSSARGSGRCCCPRAPPRPTRRPSACSARCWPARSSRPASRARLATAPRPGACPASGCSTALLGALLSVAVGLGIVWIARRRRRAQAPGEPACAPTSSAR